MQKFEPNAGYTIREAFEEAIKRAKDSNDTIHTIVNDIHINITPKSKIEGVLKYYKFKKDLAYKFETGIIKVGR